MLRLPPGLGGRPAALLGALVCSLASPSLALAGSFDSSGVYSPDPKAVATNDFENYPDTSGGAGGAAGGGDTGGAAGSGDGGVAGSGAAGSGDLGGAAGSGGTAGSDAGGAAGSGAGGTAGSGDAGTGDAGASGDAQGGAAGAAAGGGGAGGDPGMGGGPGDAGAGGMGVPPPPYTLVDDPTALAGQKVLQIAAYQSVGIGFVAPPGDGSYVARVWVKGEVVATVQVYYSDGTPYTLTQLYPTGRVTSDDWIELESPPFSVEDARGPQESIAFFAVNGGLADAFELVPGGEFRPSRSCTGIGDTTSCGADEICQSRHCYDARGFVPPMPEDQEGRNAIADYMSNRIRFLFGPYDNRHVHMPQALAQLDEMRTTASRYRFWFSFISAIQALSDSHSSAYGLFQFYYDQSEIPGRTPLNVCFLGGDADLTHDQAPSQAFLPDVLVSHTGDGATWGLKAGDRLVSVDGVHPIVWARALQGRSWNYESVNDPSSPAQAIESLRGQISTLARTIEVIRCDGGVCGDIEQIDVASQIAGPNPIKRVACDNRPLGHVPGYPASHVVNSNAFAGVVLDSMPGENIYGMTWDSLDGSEDGLQLKIDNAVKTWRQGARGVILDHRTGNGGTKDTAMSMLGFVTLPRYSEVQIWRSHSDDEGPISVAQGLTLFDLHKNDSGALAQVGSTKAELDVPVALLVTRDVSASDYFPNAFKGSPNARIFGPHPTNGAFSTFLGGAYWLGLNYQFAVEDTINHEGHALCGHGVIPDEIVAPKQSDLGMGVDTVYAAALTWVRSRLKPAEMGQ